MIRSAVVGLVAAFLAVQVSAQAIKQVEVINFPDPQNVTGQVEVTNPPTCESPARFVGYSAASFTGSAGIAPLHQACRDTFGANARMCTSAQVLATLDWPEVASDQLGWLHPIFALSNVQGYTVDVSGAQDASGNLSCRGWALSASTVSGLALYGNGSFRAEGCSIPHPVACCVPMP